jgi:hypothetical protein
MSLSCTIPENINPFLAKIFEALCWGSVLAVTIIAGLAVLAIGAPD